MSRPCVIMDLDGTLANAEHRLHLLPQNGGSWEAFFEQAEGDTPIREMVFLSNKLAEELPIFIVTGRSEDHREMSERWLEKHGVAYAEMLMRLSGDHRTDDVIKREILKKLRQEGWMPILAFEDRARVTAMWREEGLRCLQVCEGDY